MVRFYWSIEKTNLLIKLARERVEVEEVCSRIGCTNSVRLAKIAALRTKGVHLPYHNPDLKGNRTKMDKDNNPLERTFSELEEDLRGSGYY